MSNGGNASSSSSGNPFVLPWWQQALWTSAFLLLVVVAIVGNAIVIWTVACHRIMRSPTNYFLVNVSVADLLMATFNALFNFIYMLNDHWPFGLPCCVLNNFVANLTVAANVFSFVAISCDRYVAIMKPLRPKMARSSSLAIIALIWFSSGVMSLPNLMYSTLVSVPYGDGSFRHLCLLVWPDGAHFDSRMDCTYNVIFAAITYVIPMCCMLFVYSRMGRQLWGSTVIGETCQGRGHQLSNINAKRRVVCMFIVVVGIFAICWLPYHAYFIYSNLDEDIVHADNIQHVFLAIYWLAMSSTMYNPIIYFNMNARFRRYFLIALCLRKRTTLPSNATTCRESGRTQHERSSL